MKTRQLTFCAIYCAVAVVLASIFHLLPFAGLGMIFLPLHLPVMLCGIHVGWKAGGLAGVVCPLVTSLTLGMPPLYPTALAMCLELCCYGIVASLGFDALRTRIKVSLLPALLAVLCAQVAGRVLAALVTLALSGLGQATFAFPAFATVYLLTALPGILIQLVLIPPAVLLVVEGRAQVSATQPPLD